MEIIQFVLGHEYDLSEFDGLVMPFCVFCGYNDNGDARFHQQATCGGFFEITAGEMSAWYITPSKKSKEYKRFRTPKGMVIEAMNHETAKNISLIIGHGAGVEYISSATDLEYVH